MVKRKASVGNAFEFDAMRLDSNQPSHTDPRNVRRRVTSPQVQHDAQHQPLTFTNCSEDMEMDIEPTVSQSLMQSSGYQNAGQDSNIHTLSLHLQHRRSLGDTAHPPLVSPIPLRSSPLHSDLLSWMSTEHTQDVTIDSGNNRLGGNPIATTNLITSSGLPAAALLESHMPSSGQHSTYGHVSHSSYFQQPTVPVQRARSAPLPDPLTRNSFPTSPSAYQPHFPVTSIQAQMPSQRLVHNQHWAIQDQDHGMLSPSVTPDREAPQPLLMYTFPSERDTLLASGLPTPAPVPITNSGSCGPKQCFLDEDTNLDLNVHEHERLMMQDCAMAANNHSFRMSEPGVVQPDIDAHQHQHHPFFQRRF